MRHFATAPSPFIDMADQGAAFRLRSAILMLGNQCADAEESVEMFDEEQQLLRSEPKDMPSVFKRARRGQMHARSLVFAVDNFIKMIEAMIKDQAAPAAALRTTLDSFIAAVPGATALRNSLHHIEDRARRIGSGGRTIAQTGGAPAGFSVPPGTQVMFIGSNISNDVIFCTAGNGQTVELEVSDNTVRLMAQTLQEVVDAFKWKSPSTPLRIPS